MKQIFALRRAALPMVGASAISVSMTSAAMAGEIADIAGSVDFAGMKADIVALAPTVLGFVVALSTVYFVIKMVRSITRGG